MQQSSFKGRFIVGLIIAFIGWMIYINQTEENPVTGQKQHLTLTPSQEISLGLESAPVMAREMGGEVSASDPHAQEVQKIGTYLVDHTIAKKSPWKFKFHLIADTKTINAFALPGGQIFITQGLYDKLQTEAQLAGVLSHEMGHVIERHSAQQMAKSQLGQVLIVAVGAAASDPNHQTYGPTLVASLVNQMFQLRYSRHDESEADTWGLKLMSEAGYDPKAMIQVMEILKASGSRGQTPEIFQTHPNPELRIQQIEAYLKEHPPEANLSEGKKLKDLSNSTEEKS